MKMKPCLVVFGLFWLVTGSSWASCGSATCPIDTLTLGRGGPGWVRIGYDFEYINQNQPRIAKSKASIGEIPGDHDEIYTVNRYHRLNTSIGFTDRLSADILLPFIARSHQHNDNESGTPELETWDMHGLGDLTVQTRYAFFKPEEQSRPILSAILGGKFPTGAHHETNHDGAEAEPGVQPGTGSYDLILGASTLQTFSVPMIKGEFGVLPVFTSLSYQWNGRGNDNYRLGNTFLFNVGMAYPLARPLSVLAQMNLRVRERDEAGDTTEQVERTGGEFLYFSPGLEVRFGEAWTASALIQVPVYQRVNVIQLTSDYNVLASLSYRFKI